MPDLLSLVSVAARNSRAATTRVANGSKLACITMSAAWLSACAVAPKASDSAPPTAPSYEQLLDDGLQATKSNNGLRALDLWRAAARRNPTAKEPWLRMAQLHFETGNYGNAITEAQEALQRDSSDAVANGLLAVSGLRVSSAALARMQPDTFSGSARGEAESLAKTLRDLLGEPVLVPQPPVAPEPVHRVQARRSVHGTTARRGAASPAVGARPAKPAPAHDPFSALR